MNFDLGDVPTWVATLGAGVAAFYAYGAYKIESERDRRQSDMAEQEQASRVAVWPEQRDNPETGMPAEAEWIHLRNASQLPVYEARLFSYSYSPPESEAATAESVFPLGIVGPSDKPQAHFVKVSPRNSYQYAIVFRDAAGVTWHRDRRGVLKKGPLDEAGFEKSYLPSWWDA